MLLMRLKILISFLDFLLDSIFDQINLSYLGLVYLDNFSHVVDLPILLDLHFHKFPFDIEDLVILKLNISGLFRIFLSQ